MDDIIEHGSVIRGYLGVGMDDLTPDKAEFFGIKKGEGVIVTDGRRGKPREKAGIKVERHRHLGERQGREEHRASCGGIVAAIHPGRKGRRSSSSRRQEA